MMWLIILYRYSCMSWNFIVTFSSALLGDETGSEVRSLASAATGSDIIVSSSDVVWSGFPTPDGSCGDVIVWSFNLCATESRRLDLFDAEFDVMRSSTDVVTSRSFEVDDLTVLEVDCVKGLNAVSNFLYWMTFNRVLWSSSSMTNATCGGFSLTFKEILEKILDIVCKLLVYCRD